MKYMITGQQDPPSSKITARQEKILNLLIKEYIDLAEPISSKLLQKKCDLDISPATIRNDLQELAEKGYISQPHTSAGRVPTNKAYVYFVERTLEDDEHFEDFIFRQIQEARVRIERELALVQELTESLTQISGMLNYTQIRTKNGILEILELLGPSKTTYDENMNIIKELIKRIENF